MTLGEDIELDLINFNDDNLEQKYDIKNFKCTNENIDDYLYNSALKDFNDGLTVTKLFINKKNKDIVAYFSLCSSAIVYKIMGKLHYEPAIEIKMFAVNEKYQHMKYSEDEEELTLSDMILSMVIGEIRDIGEKYCGVKSVILYSVPEAYNFYDRNFFEDFNEYMVKDQGCFTNDCKAMYMIL